MLHHSWSSPVPNFWITLPKDIDVDCVIFSPALGPFGITFSVCFFMSRTGSSNSISSTPPPSPASRVCFCVTFLVVKTGVHPMSVIRLNIAVAYAWIPMFNGIAIRIGPASPDRSKCGASLKSCLKEYFGVWRFGVPSLIYFLTRSREWVVSSSSSSSFRSSSTLRLKVVKSIC